MIARQVTITAPGQAELLDCPMPDDLQPDEVRGQCLASLISPGTELSHNYANAPTPNHPGYAAVFRVEESGSEAGGVAPGQLAFCMGPHRSRQQAAVGSLLPVPEGLAPEAALTARLAAVSMTTLMTATARPGDTVLVIGAGPVGFLAAQVFRIGGYEVLVAEPSERRRGFLCHAGIEDVAASAQEFEEHAGGIALVIDCTGREDAALDGLRMLRLRGEVVLVGVPWSPSSERTAHEVMSLIFHRYAVLRSGWEWELPPHPGHFQHHSHWGSMATALRWLAEGRITVGPFVERLDPRDPNSAYQRLQAGQGEGLFPVFDWASME